MTLTQRKLVLLLAVAWGATAIGCAEQAAKNDAAKSPADSTEERPQGDSDPSTTAKAPPTIREVTLQVVTPEKLRQEIAKRQGKVVLVDFWATWCIPCIEGFHHTVEWQKAHGGKGLVVMSVSMDEPDEAGQQAALDFLRKQQAAFPNFISSLGGADDGMLAFGVEGGAVPQYKIYDRTGQLVKTFGVNSKQPYGPKDIEATLKDTLALPQP